MSPPAGACRVDFVVGAALGEPGVQISWLILHHSSRTDLTPLITHHSSHSTHHTPLILHHSSHTTHLTHHSSHTTHLTPLITHRSSHTTHPTPLIPHHSSHTTHHTPLITHHSSYTTHHTPLITRHSSLWYSFRFLLVFSVHFQWSTRRSSTANLFDPSRRASLLANHIGSTSREVQ